MMVEVVIVVVVGVDVDVGNEEESWGKVVGWSSSWQRMPAPGAAYSRSWLGLG